MISFTSNTDDSADVFLKGKGKKNWKERYDDPYWETLGQPSGKNDYYVSYKPQELCSYYQQALSLLPESPTPDLPPAHPSEWQAVMPTIFMFQPTSLHFPKPVDYEDIQDHTKHTWKIKTPVTAEAALNWQAQNATAQNTALQQIYAEQQKLTQLSTPVVNYIPEIQAKIQQLHTELLHVATFIPWKPSILHTQYPNSTIVQS